MSTLNDLPNDILKRKKKKKTLIVTTIIYILFVLIVSSYIYTRIERRNPNSTYAIQTSFEEIGKKYGDKINFQIVPIKNYKNESISLTWKQAMDMSKGNKQSYIIKIINYGTKNLKKEEIEKLLYEAYDLTEKYFWATNDDASILKSDYVSYPFDELQYIEYVYQCEDLTYYFKHYLRPEIDVDSTKKHYRNEEGWGYVLVEDGYTLVEDDGDYEHRTLPDEYYHE